MLTRGCTLRMCVQDQELGHTLNRIDVKPSIVVVRIFDERKEIWTLRSDECYLDLFN